MLLTRRTLASLLAVASVQHKPTSAAEKKPSKEALKLLQSGIDYAERAVDADTAAVDTALLKKADERFTLLLDEVAPDFAEAYTNRANVRVAMGSLDAALTDYDDALRIAPQAADAWVTHLNRGSTLVALQRPKDALEDLEQSVRLSKGDKLALLGRGSALHEMGLYERAAADYGGVLDKSPLDIQPYWLRYAMELYQCDRRSEALGIARRVGAKFDLEPEVVAAVPSMLWASGSDAERDEARQRWRMAPSAVREKARAFLSAPSAKANERQWPPSLVSAAGDFERGLRDLGEPEYVLK